jgi:hypothetical protein
MAGADQSNARVTIAVQDSLVLKGTNDGELAELFRGAPSGGRPARPTAANGQPARQQRAFWPASQLVLLVPYALPTLAEVDKDGDGVISGAELVKHLKKVVGQRRERRW